MVVVSVDYDVQRRPIFDQHVKRWLVDEGAFTQTTLTSRSMSIGDETGDAAGFSASDTLIEPGAPDSANFL